MYRELANSLPQGPQMILYRFGIQSTPSKFSNMLLHIWFKIVDKWFKVHVPCSHFHLFIILFCEHLLPVLVIFRNLMSVFLTRVLLVTFCMCTHITMSTVTKESICFILTDIFFILIAELGSASFGSAALCSGLLQRIRETMVEWGNQL